MILITTKLKLKQITPEPAASNNSNLTGGVVIDTTNNELISNNFILIKNDNITKGESPSETIYNGIEVYGSSINNYTDRIGRFGLDYYSDQKIEACMSVVDQAGNDNIKKIAIGFDSTGTLYTSAPTPATTDNSTQIATTAYVKSNLNNYLPLSGGTITGTIESTNPWFGKMSTDTSELVLFGGNAVDTSNPVISLRGKSKSKEPGTVYIRACTTTSNPKILFLSPNGEMRWGKDASDYLVTGHFRCQVPSLTKGTAPSSTTYGGLYTLCDKNGTVYGANALGLVGTSVTTSNIVSTYIRALKNEANSTVNCQISCNVDASGNAYTSAPTPATSDNSNKIATTAYVKAQKYATLASPALTGTPTAPTASVSTNNTQIATTAFVKSAMSTWNAVTVTSVTTYCASGLGGYMSVYQNPYLKLCCVSLNIQLLATTIPGSTAIINGFPKALKNSGLNCIDSSSNGVRMFINTNGALCLDGSKTFSAATWVNGSITYPYSSL